MAKYELKTKPTNASVEAFLAAVPGERRRQDAQELCQLIEEVTGDAPKMWGDSIVGFGSYQYKNVSGHEGDWMTIGFSPRKRALVLYSPPQVDDFDAMVERLHPHSTGRSCIYIKRLEEVDRPALEELIRASHSQGPFNA